MNTLMYEHPLTAQHLRVVQEVVKYHVVGPVGKGLACGDVGMQSIHALGDTLLTSCLGLGAMTEWKDIVKIVVDKMQLQLKPQTH
jgi:phosphopantothenoylcysteine decarboxylase